MVVDTRDKGRQPKIWYYEEIVNMGEVNVPQSFLVLKILFPFLDKQPRRC